MKNQTNQPQYKVINIGNPSESIKTRTERILSQIPKGKAIAITDKDLSLPQNKIIVKIMNIEDIPKITRQKKESQQ
jgi:hypothetical protein